MNIETLYRISSHNQIVEVDDVSTSLDKVSKKVILFEKQLPNTKDLGEFLRKKAIGTIAIIDSFNKTEIKAFDILTGAENGLKVHKVEEIEAIKAVICQPEGFLTFFNGQCLSIEPKTFKVKVVTLSDRAYRGIYEDKSGPKVVELVKQHFKSINKTVEVDLLVIPDNKEDLIDIIIDSRDNKWDLLLTTGGTGIGKRDITVDTIESFIGKQIPGIMEMIRVKYGKSNPKALLSRGIAGIMNETLVYTLPGGVNAVSEYLSEIFITLDHLFYMLNGIDNH